VQEYTFSCSNSCPETPRRASFITRSYSLVEKDSLTMKRTLALAALCLALSTTALAQTVTPAPELLNFQGKLATPSGNPVSDGTYNIRFSLWSASTGGTEKWFQTMNPVLVKNGTFAVLLGNGNPITADILNGNSIYLEIKVGNDAALSPRQRIASVAYALKANTVPDNAITTNKIADGAITTSKLGAGIGAFLGGVPSSYLILGYTPTAPTGYTFTNETLSNNNVWTTATSLSQANSGRPACATINGKIYYIGGNSGNTGSTTADTNFIFNPTTGIWTTGATMPAPRQNAGVAVLNGKIHVIGGAAPAGTRTATHFVYDPVTDTWDTTKQSLPVATTQGGAVAYGNSIYFMGGASASGTLATAYVYDDTTDVWTPKASMLVAHAQYASAIIGQKIYVMGGWSGNSVIAGSEVYDIASNTWSVIAPMPTIRNAHVAAVINGKIIVFGGTQTSNTSTAPPVGVTEEYDPALNIWQSRVAMPTARYNSGAAIFNNSIYIMGGTIGGTASAANEVYIPSRVYYVHQKN